MWLFAINGKSGGGRGLKAWRKVEAELKRLDVDYAAVLSETPETARRAITRLLREHNGIVQDEAPRQRLKAITIIGGDGTIHGILPAVCDSGVPLGIIPAGSGNDTARAFGIPKRPLDALRIVLQGRAYPADIIAMRDPKSDIGYRPVLTALAAGFDSAIAAAVNRSVYKKLCNLIGAGSFAYVIGLIQVLLTFRPRPIAVTVDGETHCFRQGWMAAVCNASAYGGGLRICPDAKPDDGMLNVCVVHSCTPLQLLRLFPLILSGKHTRLPYVALFSGQAVAVEDMAGDPAKPAIAVYGDGEPAGELPLYAEAAGNRIEVLR
ncbi:diacylglycerol/lipid kinase family protein [Paenibacillus sacheonensis]|uniref:YegS/Rv2252/BmrU family lipid kinase n=1 Tax=Paenibacillus sacheonensis TaxID=742054 RepID=A0A7X4YW30_9BACL|nr:diacylglycerol kinase family protein [Paenibacillus sacheonensis]MBM7568961.1 YegS/Rv2252/BmrU family lipid kinase [Paenibacillus sacheonensis]NBC72666.1 YegS/Rv2252/BmrU family lipid kinase [Paenibacillus sacheonensis]